MLGRQELDGQLLEDAEGALWSSAMLEKGRLEHAPAMDRIVVAVDPPVTGKASSDECGIVVVGAVTQGPVQDWRAYVLADAEGKRQVILIASGSEVSVAMAARDILQAEGIGVRVVSMPCMELFAEQDEAYRKRVLPGGAVRVGVEAGVRQGWDQWLLGERGKFGKADFVGMDRFGASAPAEELFEKFGITASNVAEKAKALL